MSSHVSSFIDGAILKKIFAVIFALPNKPFWAFEWRAAYLRLFSPICVKKALPRAKRWLGLIELGRGCRGVNKMCFFAVYLPVYIENALPNYICTFLWSPWPDADAPAKARGGGDDSAICVLRQTMTRIQLAIHYYWKTASHLCDDMQIQIHPFLVYRWLYLEILDRHFPTYS